MRAAKRLVPAAYRDVLAVAGFRRLLARRPELLGLLVLTAVFCLLYEPVEVALPLFVVDTLGRSADFLGAYWPSSGWAR